MIEISAQYGDPRSTPIFFPMQSQLNDLFEKLRARDYFATVKMVTIVFRVSGRIRDFGADGPERFRYGRKRNEFTVDLTVPESKWLDRDKSEVRQVLKDGLTGCLEVFVEKAKQFGEFKNEEKFVADFNAVLREFAETN